MQGAEYLARSLSLQGVSHVFLVPAILRRGLVEMERMGIHRVVTHGEKAAAYMADGFARIRQAPAVAMAQSVGAANLAAGLQDAFLAHSPVIALTGRKAPRYQYRNAYQEVRHGPLFDPVTKFKVSIDDAEQLPMLLPQLFREAVTGTPGPVHADLMGLSGEGIEQGAVSGPPPAANPQFARFPAFRPAAEGTLVREALARLKAAQRPMFVAGGGAMVSGAHQALRTLAETLAIPVATSNDGKGILPETHPLAVGVVGSYSRQCANRAVGEADLVCFVGSATGDQVTLDWTLPGQKIPVVQIDLNPAELGRNYPHALGLHGDARTVLTQMAEALGEPRPLVDTAWSQRVRGYVREWEALIHDASTAEDTPIRPQRLCHEIGRHLPVDAILVADTGYSCIWAGTMIPITQPGQRFMRAAGSLGWAFPAALGAKCAAPERPVVCFCGDGAFLYHLGELETARRWSIRTVTIINNNSFYGQSIPGTLNAYGDTPGNPEQVVRFTPTNYARIAEDFDCIGIRVERPDAIAPALQRAFAADRPVVIDVVTTPESHPPPLWRPS